MNRRQLNLRRAPLPPSPARYPWLYHNAQDKSRHGKPCRVVRQIAFFPVVGPKFEIEMADGEKRECTAARLKPNPPRPKG